MKKDAPKKNDLKVQPSSPDGELAELRRIADSMRQAFPCIAPADAMAKALESRDARRAGGGDGSQDKNKGSKGR